MSTATLEAPASTNTQSTESSKFKAPDLTQRPPRSPRQKLGELIQRRYKLKPLLPHLNEAIHLDG